MFSLVLSNLVVRRVRTLLTALAIGLSCSLVVVVTSGYASILAGAETFLTRFVGTADAEITRPQNVVDGLVPEKLVDELRADPDVHRVTGRLEAWTNLYDASGKRLKVFHLVGIQRPQDTRVDVLNFDKGTWFDGSDGSDAVADQLAAGSLKADVGSTFFVPSGSDRIQLKIVGIVHKPELFATAVSTIYVPLGVLQKVNRNDAADPQVSQISIDLNHGADVQAFAARWGGRIEQINHVKEGAPLRLRLISQTRSETESNLEVVHLISYVGSGIAMLAGTFIIFSALAMGVTEQQRTLAMLRAIGATRRQVAGMVVLEGVIISFLGAVFIGVPLGIALTYCLQWLFKGFIFFAMGVQVSQTGIVLAVAEAILAAVAASLLPAWTASRTSPLEAMSPLAEPATERPPVGWALFGLALASIDPLVFHLPWENFVRQITPAAAVDQITTLFRFYAHFLVGVASLFVGFFFIAPLFIWVLERSLAPMLGRLFRLPQALLRQQLSHGLWRSAGAAAALTCGLTLLVVMTTDGISMLSGWRLPNKFPDLFLLSLKPGGVAPADWKTLGATPGIRRFADGSPQLMPIAMAAPGLGNNPLALVGAVLSPQLNGTLFFGVPPKAASEMMELDFRDDNGQSVPRDQQSIYAQRAQKAMEQGRSVIVTEDYRRLHHVKYGDKITFYGESGKYDYTVCGIVWSPGLDVFVGIFDMGRVFDARTAGMVLGSLDDAARDFGATNVNAFLANIDVGLDKTVLLDRIKQRMGDLNVRTGDVRQVKATIDSQFRRLLALLTLVAFSAMAVASLGVTNTIMASIRVRRWHLGVLRSIGLCRGELLRLVLVEALLLGLTGMILGWSSGGVLASDSRLLSAGVLGYLPPLVIPWFYAGIGGAAVTIVSVVAAIWPAITVSRTEPLALLQAGRAAT